LAIRKTLAAADPSNADKQRDLSVSYERLGDVLVAEGKLGEARKSFEDALAIRKTLAAADPSNADKQRDLSVSYWKSANIAVAQGRFDEAQTALEDGKRLAERLQLRTMQSAFQAELNTFAARRQRPSDPCARVSAERAEYCGGSRQNGFPGGNVRVLYECHAGRTVSTKRCSSPCIVAPYGTADSCSL
jgi:tetratricopeptide (TPR) repeat protein